MFRQVFTGMVVILWKGSPVIGLLMSARGNHRVDWNTYPRTEREVMNRTNRGPLEIVAALRAQVEPMKRKRLSAIPVVEAADTIESLQAEVEVLQATKTALHAEVEMMRGILGHIADWPDANMETARTLHYDWRGWAREALGRE